MFSANMKTWNIQSHTRARASNGPNVLVVSTHVWCNCFVNKQHRLTERDSRLTLFCINLGFGLRPVQNLTSHSRSPTQISYKCDEISRLSRLESPILGYLGFSGFWEYLARLPSMQNLTSYYSLTTPISYKGDKILCVSCIVSEIPILGYMGVLEFSLGGGKQ